ncbi:hypothetical protein MASR2M78_36970 [Treponema sp.]
MLNSYSTIDSIAQDGVPYSAIIQQSGIARYIDSDSRMTEEDLYITTLFSRFENQQRLASINRIVITVSLVIAAFTLLISFGLARTITSPIRKLRDAMHSVKAGNFEMILEDTLKGEMGELLQGFNEMASQLAEDRLSQDKYIAEIIRLKEYDERVFNSIREGLVVVNAVFNIEKANHAFLQYFNLTIEDVTGRNIDELSIGLFDESLHVDIRAIVSGELNEEVQVRRTPSGISYEIKLYSLYEASRPKNDRIHCILIIENISRRIAYEEGIFQAEKLAGISMLSAGLAHEINNPLSAILSNVQNLLAIDRPASEMADLRIVEQETRRIARIVRNLLNFSSARSDEGEGTDMNYVVAELLELVRFSIKNESQVNIETELEGNLPRAAIGADEFKQVTLNLVKNSLQAIGKNGTILLRSRLCNDRLEFSVQDSGCGIKPDLLQRIFDPFFTTKAVDGNTGLGLSVVYGIVTKCGGSVAVESEDGRGTTIRVELPILDFKGRYGSRT